MSFYRGRRLRRNAAIRAMMRESVLQPQDLIYPIFVEEGRSGKQPIAAMPGIAQYGLDALHEVVEEMRACGVRACILFGIPKHDISLLTDALSACIERKSGVFLSSASPV